MGQESDMTEPVMLPFASGEAWEMQRWKVPPWEKGEEN